MGLNCKQGDMAWIKHPHQCAGMLVRCVRFIGMPSRVTSVCGRRTLSTYLTNASRELNGWWEIDPPMPSVRGPVHYKFAVMPDALLKPLPGNLLDDESNDATLLSLGDLT